MKWRRHVINWGCLLLAGWWIVSNYNHNAFLKFAIYVFKVLAWMVFGALVYELIRQNFYKFRSDTRDLKRRIDAMGKNYVARRPNAALIIAFCRRGNFYCKGFGKVSDANPDPPDAQTIFEIGSVTKVFTALALAKMANDGSVKLDDFISRYLPEGVNSPKRDGVEITLKNLATHTSGLPRLPDNFWPTVKDKLNPYANYSTQDLYAGLATVKLRRIPGRRSSYSNYGYGLLGKILELKSGKSYEALIQESVCAPLGLRNTTTQLSEGQKRQLTPGHSPAGEIVPNWDGDTLAGCGRILSNAGDLLKFIEANLADADTEISNILQMAQQVHFKGLARDIGLGWQINTGTLGGPALHWHNGGTGGYVSFIGFDKKHQTGVVVLSNYGAALVGDTSTDQIGMNLLKMGDKISLE
jgi:CubicO group peptidase (beta-lactamase class C family)